MTHSRHALVWIAGAQNHKSPYSAARRNLPRGNLKGRPMDDRELAARLRKYEIKRKVVRRGEHTYRGYERADLAVGSATSRLSAQGP